MKEGLTNFNGTMSQCPRCSMWSAKLHDAGWCSCGLIDGAPYPPPDRRQTPRTIEDVWSEAARAEYRKGKDFLFQGTVNIAELAKRRYSGKGA